MGVDGRYIWLQKCYTYDASGKYNFALLVGNQFATWAIITSFGINKFFIVFLKIFQG